MKFFFIGIKGSGMSALACILHDLGHEVKGCDVDKHFFTEKNLLKRNIEILPFGNYDFIDVDEVILGNSYNEEHEDYKKAKTNNIKITRYYQKLNELILKNESIAVSGANGKTTTTGLLVSSLLDESISYLIGDGTGVGNQSAKKFIFEACEYKNTFLNYNPKIALINNIEFDHPDYFKDIDDMINSFQKFANNAQILVANGDDKNVQVIKHDNKYTFGYNPINTLQVKNVEFTRLGMSFTLIYKGEELGTYSLPFFGEYMLYNSLGVILINLLFERDINIIIKNLSTFKGVSRRFSETIINEKKNIILIDDYAHHPSAIRETLKAIRQKYSDLEVISIFQPHTFSRVEAFSSDFAYELTKSDYVLIDSVFKAARETVSQNNENAIEQKIQELGFENKLIEITNLEEYKTNVVICLFGAGDIDLKYKDKIISMY